MRKFPLQLTAFVENQKVPSLHNDTFYVPKPNFGWTGRAAMVSTISVFNKCVD
jgi:hypothetical protein